MPCTKSNRLSGGRPSSLSHGLDDSSRLGLGEAALAQEVRTVVIRAGHNALPSRLDAGDEGRRARIGEALQSGGRLMGEARRRVLAVADGDFLEILDAPEVPVLAHRPEI